MYTMDGVHEQEVCSLKWNADGEQLASGGNDNNVSVSNIMRLSSRIPNMTSSGPSPRSSIHRNNTPSLVQRCVGHRAAIRALAWSPHERDILCSGGGTLDPSLCFWTIGQIKTTGSQVCALAWMRTENKLISAHGLPKTDLQVWHITNDLGKPKAFGNAVSDVRHEGTLHGHVSRVLEVAFNAMEDTIISAAGGADETIRFWKIPHSLRRLDLQKYHRFLQSITL